MSKPFELGICMAGAVSAGAYTAGVMDFLIEALQTWEDKKGQPNIPKHEVIIKAIGGASAGGMTGIIAATALNNPIVPVTNANPNNLLEKKQNNKFYHAWVDLIADDMFPKLLDTDDISKGKIYSLFNAQFIDDVAKKSLRVDPENRIQRAYVEEYIKIFTTLTNLEGFKYNTLFNGAMTNNNYHLSHHADYATFILNKAEAQYANDGWIPLDFFNEVNSQIASDAAMATGAFPIGLRSRKIIRNKKYINDLDWNHPLLKEFRLPANVLGSEDLYEALIIDGGTLNNEPFERVKSLINNVSSNENSFEGTTLMIDPFPSYAKDFDISTDGVSSILGKTLSAMLGHLRSKPEVLEKMFVKNDVSQYQIAPVRYNGTEKIEGSKAIACGFMGGFGGFIHKEFRIHDFFLGRANCEHFLREHFTIDTNTTNSTFSEGYEGITTNEFVSSKGKRQIIPVFKLKDDNMYMPTFENGGIWPTRKEADIDRFKKALRKRAGAIVMNAADYNWRQRILVGAGNRIILRKLLAKNVLKVMKSAMVDHKLLID
jgi:hypothetical protein